MRPITEGAPLQAIPTIYKGIQLRSRMEAQCALLFDTLGWKWEYEKKSYMLPSGIAYRPDFWMPYQGVVVECRGYESDKGRKQIEGFAANYEDLDIIDKINAYVVIGPDDAVIDDGGCWARAGVIFCPRCIRWSIGSLDIQECNLCLKHIGADCIFRLSVGEGRIFVSGLGSDSWSELLLTPTSFFDRWRVRVISKMFALIYDMDISWALETAKLIDNGPGCPPFIETERGFTITPLQTELMIDLARVIQRSLNASSTSGWVE